MFPKNINGSIIVQATQLNGNQNLSLSIGDACGIAEFGLDHKTFLN